MGNLGWYTARARQMSPGVVAKVAARRAWRTARQLLYRYGQSPTDPQLLEAFGAQSLEELPDKCLVPRPGAFCDPSRREGTVMALLELPDAAERAWARAERALSRTFTLFDREVAFGPGGQIEWSVDPISGYRYPLESSTSLQLFPAGVDPKYPWQLGRQDALVALGQGYWLASAPEERKRFSSELVAQASDFLRSNPPNLGIHWTCPMEVALRAANLAISVYLCRDAPAVREPGFLLQVLRALSEHTAFVEANLEDKGAVPNNHLLADLVGLLVVGTLFPQLPGATGQVATAVRKLREQVPLQVGADGVSFEDATGYQRLVAELCVLAVHFARAGGLLLGEEVEARTHGLLSVAAHLCTEAGLAPQLGDNDSGRALPLADRPSLDHGYLAGLGAVLFEDPSLKVPESPLCEEAVWLFGEEGGRTWSGLDACFRPASFSALGGGANVLRGGNGFVALAAGARGQGGAGGHSHNDRTSFELHVHGVPTIVDGGSPVYGRDPDARNAFRSSLAHNAVVVDGEEQAPFDPDRLFALPEGPRCRVERFEQRERVDVLCAVHHGYERLAQPVTVRRVFSLHKDLRALRIDERFEGRGEHGFRVGLLLPDVHVRLRGPRGEERQRAASLLEDVDLDETLAVELGPRDAPLATVLVQSGIEVSLEEASCARGYGEEVPAVRVVLSWRDEVPGHKRWVVLWDKERRVVEG